MSKNKRVITTLYLNEEQARALGLNRLNTRVSASELIRSLIDRWMAEQRKDSELLEAKLDGVDLEAVSDTK